MKFLSLERLVGPGKSVDENFEIMNLELLKVDLPQHESFRLAAPDGGIDIFCRAIADNCVNLAIQCKAYPTFRFNLVRAVAESSHAAVSSIEMYPWKRYVLSIPFVPTALQRTRLQEALKECTLVDHRYKPHICDGDELEATLFRYPSVARRFFPDLTIVTPSEQGRIILGYPDDPSMLQLTLKIYTWRQTFPVSVSPTAKAGSLLQMLIGQLTLPVKGSVPFFMQGYDIKWELILETETEPILDLEKTLPEQGVTRGATISLKYNFSLTGWGAFADGGAHIRNHPEEHHLKMYLESFFDNKIYDKPIGIRELPNFEDWVADNLRASESILPKQEIE
jgi:hypothetical protein